MEENKMNRVLFIIKKRELYSEGMYTNVNSGLFNSANFVNTMLIENGVASKLVQVIDNNDIDKAVTEFKPTTVIIEALWVVPSKFEILQKLHPTVKWIIRLHSELPFIANEGVAIKWLKEYGKYENVEISSNSIPFIKSMNPILNRTIIYTPNYYPLTEPLQSEKDGVFNVGLFGAIRPMKNCLTQAVAAIIYAEKHNKTLNLHINTERVEQKGENVLKNIRALFEDTPHKLIEHKWLSHSNFVELISKMDIGLQVSLSETYNIVAADFVNQKIPIVVSKEIMFVSSSNKSKSTKNALDIVKTMENVLGGKKDNIVNMNRSRLRMSAIKSKNEWLQLFR